MSFTDIMILAGFIVGIIPTTILLIMYSRINWRATVAGRALFYLVSVTAVSYGLSLCVLLFPSSFQDGIGEVIRISIRFAIAFPLWNLLRLFIIAQRSGNVRPETQEALDGLETARVFIEDPESLPDRDVKTKDGT